MLIDLQLHSNFSDGYLKPADLVKFIKKQGVKVASLTDHNTVAGWEEFSAEAKKQKIKAIIGLELYVKYKGKKINLLWYNFNKDNKDLQKILESSRRLKALSVKRILLKLKRRGYKIDINKILSYFENYIPVNRLADKLMENKFNYNLVLKNIKKKSKAKIIMPLREEAILGELFFNKDIGLLTESYINAERLLKIKKDVGGQIIFCHPGKYNKFKGNMVEKLTEDKIIDGIEVLSPHHSIGAVMYAQFLAEKLDLIASGGSDFHRYEANNFLIQSAWDWFWVDSKYLRKIKNIIN